jgi:hypothetical protein
VSVPPLHSAASWLESRLQCLETTAASWISDTLVPPSFQSFPQPRTPMSFHVRAPLLTPHSACYMRQSRSPSG